MLSTTTLQLRRDSIEMKMVQRARVMVHDAKRIIRYVRDRKLSRRLHEFRSVFCDINIGAQTKHCKHGKAASSGYIFPKIIWEAQSNQYWRFQV